MRVRNLIAAVLVTSSVLAIGGSIASAAKHPSLNGGCKVNINAAPRVIESGESVTVFGRLACVNRAGAAYRTVKLLQHAALTLGFGVVQTTTTDARGFYSFQTAGVESDSAFFVRSRGAASGSRTVKVLARVSVNGPPEGTQLLTGVPNRVNFTGTVSPFDEGATVVLQRQNAITGDEWHRIDLGRVGPGGDYSITHTFVVPGDANIRVLVRSQRRNIPSPSDVLTYEISQAQNPNLTINSLADPIVYGTPVTISGTAAAVAGQPVTLLARTAAQTSFAPISQVTTEGNGDYRFPAQVPLASTSYEVQGAGRTSATLYEGVKDVLTAGVSQTTIQSGQMVTFSGSVAPDHGGHVIYLQRQDRSGGGFHVVQVGLVKPGSVYALAYEVYGAGTQVYRVKIPGGPENEGAASPLFTLTVAPAAPAALKPEAPSNSTLPSEGEV